MEIKTGTIIRLVKEGEFMSKIATLIFSGDETLLVAYLMNYETFLMSI